ncbi:radical SAM protein (plasmid) [Paraclostridium bifermentans]|uniref:Radical SAM protein n=1 Tax=Paraclostridium bifermentans TaxID=1490 RepID=A0A5P3XKF5_PARBF|nr:radical SAM protein [Paraclostridium bifermentans]QEZ70831.1 radical SAM protein [Paraclostridium bifermentans]
MKDIIFINPPGLRTGPYFPVGIGYLNEILLMNKINSQILDVYNFIEVGDLNFDSSILYNIENILKNNKSKIYAITINSASLFWSIEIIKIIKKLYPDSKILVGGPHITILGEDIYKLSKNIDAALVFEGEKVIYPVVKALLDNDFSKLKTIKNIHYLNEEGKICFNGYEDINNELDKLPIINVDRTVYKNINGIAVDVGRGCSLECYFCETNYIWNKKSRFKSVPQIAKESQHYFDLIRNEKRAMVHYTHDNFLIDKKIIRELINEKNKNSYDFNYACTTRIDFIDSETIDLLSDSSCKSIFFGIESGSSRIQNISKKQININKIIPKIKLICDKGIFVESNFIIGFPEETLSEAYDTLELMSNIRWVNPTFSTVDFNMMSPVSKSPLGKATQEKDFIINELHKGYKSLIECNVEVDEKLLNYNRYYYMIHNENYDIKELRNFAIFYLSMLNGYPISLYIIRNIGKVSIENLHYHFNKAKISTSDLRDNNLIYKFMEYLISYYDLSVFKEYLLFENTRLNVLFGDVNNIKKIDFDSKLKETYKKLKYNPEILYEIIN